MPYRVLVVTTEFVLILYFKICITVLRPTLREAFRIVEPNNRANNVKFFFKICPAHKRHIIHSFSIKYAMYQEV